MSGIEILNALPVWAVAIGVIGVCIIFSVGLQLLTRWHFGVDRLIVNHKVAGFKYAVVSVSFAVLLAFVVVGVWAELVRTEHAVGEEAERFYNLHQSSDNFPEQVAGKIRQALIAYAIAVRDKDWPMMERGQPGSRSATEAYARLSVAVGQVKAENIGLLPSANHAIILMQQIADLRTERLADVGGPMRPAIWSVLLLGAIITLGYPSFFATKDIAAQVLMTTGLAAVVGAILFLTIHLNYPFSGPGRLTAQPIDDVIQRMLIENKAGGDPSKQASHASLQFTAIIGQISRTAAQQRQRKSERLVDPPLHDARRRLTRC